MSRAPLVRPGRRARAALAVPALVLLGGSLLVGCGDSEEEQAEQAAEAVLGEDADVDIDGDSVTFDDGDTSITSGSGLPDGFPEDLPVLEGEILSGMASDDGSTKNYSVIVSASGDPASAAAEVKGLLEDAGWTLESENEMEGLSTLRFSKDGTEVGVNVLPGDTGDGSQVMYAVTPAS